MVAPTNDFNTFYWCLVVQYLCFGVVRHHSFRPAVSQTLFITRGWGRVCGGGGVRGRGQQGMFGAFVQPVLRIAGRDSNADPMQERTQNLFKNS